jgi:hypothetical protein
MKNNPSAMPQQSRFIASHQVCPNKKWPQRNISKYPAIEKLRVLHTDVDRCSQKPAVALNSLTISILNLKASSPAGDTAERTKCSR